MLGLRSFFIWVFLIAILAGTAFLFWETPLRKLGANFNSRVSPTVKKATEKLAPLPSAEKVAGKIAQPVEAKAKDEWKKTSEGAENLLVLLSQKIASERATLAIHQDTKYREIFAWFKSKKPAAPQPSTPAVK